jgi:hypothetical protein
MGVGHFSNEDDLPRFEQGLQVGEDARFEERKLPAQTSPRNYPGRFSQREPKSAKATYVRSANLRGVVRGALAPLFNVVLMQKDMRLALEQGRAVGVPLPATGLVHELLTGARGLGLAEKDFAAVFDVLAKLSGLPGS